MKKNRMMRLASVLLVCVLLTTSVISGTFAKYTTTNTASDEARVAYWGFDAAANITFDLFDVKTAGDTGVAADGLLAPGTERTINFEFINAKADDRAPEVAYEVVVSAANSTAPSAELDAQIVWIYNGDGYEDWADFIAAIEGETAQFAPGELPDFLKSGATNTVGWAWEFEDGSDEADTALGNAASVDGIDVKLNLTVTLNQLTEAPVTNP